MARGMNHIFLLGTLVRNPELRYTEGHTPLAILEAVIAGEDSVTSYDHRSIQVPWYHRVQLLGKNAEWIGRQNLTSGTPVFVEGSLEYRSWTDATTNNKRSMIRIKARRLEAMTTDEAYTPPITQDSGGGFRMQGGMNDVLLVGNLTRDVSIRHTQGGAVTDLGLAVSESWYDRSTQEWQEKPHWIDVTLWRELAEKFQHLTKGTPLVIRGRLINQSWTDQEGNKRSSIKVEATRVEVLARGATHQNSEVAATPVAPQQIMGSAASGISGTTSATAAIPVAAPPSPASQQNSQNSGNQSGGLDIEHDLDDNDQLSEDDNLPF